MTTESHPSPTLSQEQMKALRERLYSIEHSNKLFDKTSVSESILSNAIELIREQDRLLGVAVETLRIYQAMDDGTAKLLAGFKERPDTIDDDSVARWALRQIEGSA